MNATVVVTNHRYKEQLQRRYPAMQPAVVITNGYDHVKFGKYSESLPSDGVCRILHAGMLTDQRNGAAFLRGVRIFLDGEPNAAENLEVMFVGAREDENDRLVREFDLERIVKIHDGVSHDDSLKLMHSSDILLVIALPHQMPGKFFEYVGARKPILAVVSDGEIKDIVERLKRGEVAAADDPEKIAARLKLMYAKHTAGTLMTDYDLSEVPEYQRERLTATLAKCLNELTS
jgi:glycosyltransferase involved in cell wall biosynthesis